MLRLRSWGGRYSADQLVGHTNAVRAVRLLPGHNLLASASTDRTVRLWDLSSGLPLAASRPHGGTVRCLAAGPAALASGCTDGVVRVWGCAAAAAPPPHAPASARAAWGSQGRSWGGGWAERWDEEEEEGAWGQGGMPLFDVTAPPALLRGHSGPVSCLSAGEAPGAAAGRGGWYGSGGGDVLYSGSWDCTVRIWRQAQQGEQAGAAEEGEGEEEEEEGDAATRGPRGGGGGGGGGGSSGDESSDAAAIGSTSVNNTSSSDTDGGGSRAAAGRRRNAHSHADVITDAAAGGWACTGVLQYGDWVYCCAARGDAVLVAAGAEVVVTDAVSGRAVRRFRGLHEGPVTALEGSRCGRLLFTGGGDGLVLAHDLRMKQGSRLLWHHRSGVAGLAFEDPWLASAGADGVVMLQDSERALGSVAPRALSATCRALQCPAGAGAGGGTPLCLDLADQRLAAGTEGGMVRLWDFSGATAAEERTAAGRAARAAAKAGRAAAKQRQEQPEGHHVPRQQPQPPHPHQQPAAARERERERPPAEQGPGLRGGTAPPNAAAAVAGGTRRWEVAAVAAAVVAPEGEGRGGRGAGSGQGHGRRRPLQTGPPPPPPPQLARAHVAQAQPLAPPPFRYVGSGAGEAAGGAAGAGSARNGQRDSRRHARPPPPPPPVSLASAAQARPPPQQVSIARVPAAAGAVPQVTHGSEPGGGGGAGAGCPSGRMDWWH